jgi:outer membrane protein assembly factor BamB
VSRLVVVGLCACGLAADWPGFRGNGTAVSPETNLPEKFDRATGEGLRWTAPLPARGVSSPVVVGDRVYVTCSDGVKGDRLHVLAFDPATGKQLWHRQLAATGPTACHPKTCMAAPTPVADATGVYALFASGDLAAFDRDGALRWYRSFPADYPGVSNQVGMAASPVLAAGRLFVPMDNTVESFVAALDPATGANVWKQSRPKETGWLTPCVRTTADGKPEVVFPSLREAVAYDPATGNRNWSFTVGSEIPSPTPAGDRLVLAGRGFTVLTFDGNKPAKDWASVRLGTGMSSPLVYQGKVYAANPAGTVTCADLATGKVLWTERVKGPFSGSPVAADGKLYLINEAGVLTVLMLGDTPEVLASSDTKEEGLATPAVSGGAVFLRGDKTLFCVGPKPTGE